MLRAGEQIIRVRPFFCSGGAAVEETHSARHSPPLAVAYLYHQATGLWWHGGGQLFLGLLRISALARLGQLCVCGVCPGGREGQLLGNATTVWCL